MDEASRWNTLKELFEQALLLPPAERTAFLDAACRDAPDLRADLSALLDCHEEAPAFFDALARTLFAGHQSPPEDWLHPDRRTVGHYRIVERLGGGGMGVVYKAHDTKLGRHVALKFLPSHLSFNDDAKHRFIHEAQSASALDHSNIATIHEVGETDDGHLFIAMAYYEGETLKKKIERGPLPVPDALDYAAQVARGMTQAHAHGIVHRDIKPANVIVTEPAPGGLRVAKILDFGLAKMADLPLTTPGTLLGTVAYMSPEQARGEAVDPRTDVWSLGVTLYEMLTGERPFRGDYPQAVIYAIRNEDPAPLATRNPDVPPDLEPIVRRCLEKDPEQRYPGMAELLADLEVWTRPAPPPLGRARAALVAALSVALTLALLLAVAPVRKAVLSTLGLGGSAAPMHLAVLPLLPAGTDSVHQDYTSGLAETLAGTLARLERPEHPLRVVPTQDLRQFGVTNPAEAREKLGATLAVTVFAERGADSVRVTLDLMDAATQRSRDRREIAQPATARGGLANELVAALVGMLGVDLTPAMERVLTAGTTTAPDAERFYTLGRGLLQRYQEARNIDEAIRHFEQALRYDSAYALAYAGLGEAYWRKFEATKEVHWAEQAERYCERALALEDRISPSVYVTLGFVYLGQGLPGFAKGAFELALKQEPGNASAFIGLARAFEDLGRPEEAEGAYRTAIDLKPEYWAGWNALGAFFYRQGHLAEAVDPFVRVKELTPLNARGYRNLAGVYFGLERKQDAYAELLEGLRLEPDYIGYSNLASMYAHDGDFRQAAVYYTEALKLQPTDFRVWGNLGSAHYWSGDHAAARAAYEEAIQHAEHWLASVNPDDATVLALLGLYYACTGQSGKARSLLEDAAEPEPVEVEVLARIGDAYEFMGDRDAALVWFESAFVQGYVLGDEINYPSFRGLREDPRFQRLLAQYGEEHHH